MQCYPIQMSRILQGHFHELMLLTELFLIFRQFLERFLLRNNFVLVFLFKLKLIKTHQFQSTHDNPQHSSYNTRKLNYH